MAKIKIYTDLEAGVILFEGSTVRPQPLGTVVAVAHPTETDRMIIKSTILKPNGSERILFKRFHKNRVMDKDGVILTNTGLDRDGVLSYFNTEFTKTLDSAGAEYKGVWDASTNSPDLTAKTPLNGDFYIVTTAGTYLSVDYNVNDIIRYSEGHTSWDRIPDQAAKVSEIEAAATAEYALHVDATYTGEMTGSSLRPFNTLAAAIAQSSEGDAILVKGQVDIASELVLPHGLTIIGAEGSCVQYATYDATNGDVFSFIGTDNTQTFKFKNLTIKNAGGYGLLIEKALKVTIEECNLLNNGWNGTGLSTVLGESGGVLGYDSDQADLQAFYAGANASNGGAMRIEEAPQVSVIANTIDSNLRGIRLQDCGINGGGFITRNQATNNIDSGIYLATGSLGGTQNLTVVNNYVAFNANNGLLSVGGINNKFSQNEVKGNWNAGLCAWGSANLTLRDSGLYDNNRSEFNGIGNSGDAKASIQIKDADSYLATTFSLNEDSRFITEILDTQVHYTGLGSNTAKIGVLLTSGMGLIPLDDKNIIKIDDVGFIGQDYAIDLSECDISNLHVTLGDNSYQKITTSAVRPALAGNYAEVPFSNHVTSVPVLDIVLDTLKRTVALHNGIGGDVINVYGVNELQSILGASSVDIIQRGSNKIQLRGLTLSNVYINGVVAGNSLTSMNDTMNSAFIMDLVAYSDFLSSEVGVNSGGGSSLPAQQDNWYISYGARALEQITAAGVNADLKNQQPFYNGDVLERGHEYIWTHDNNGDYSLGIWSGATTNNDEATAQADSNWSLRFVFGDSVADRVSPVTDASISYHSVGVDIDSRFATGYAINNSTILALRYGEDNHLYLLDITSGNEVTIGKSNAALVGDDVTIQMAGENQPNAKFPIFMERTNQWGIVHDYNDSEDGEWADGIEPRTIIKSNVSAAPGQKIKWTLPATGGNRHYGIGYGGAATGESQPVDSLADSWRWDASEIIHQMTGWTFNTAAAGYGANTNHPTKWAVTTGLGVEVSYRHQLDNTLEMWDETNNELIMTLNNSTNGDDIHLFFGANSYSSGFSQIPQVGLYDIAGSSVGSPTEETHWYYVESPDGNFNYPLFKTEEEADAIDTIEGGTGTSISMTFIDDLSNTTWYRPTTNSVTGGAYAPEHGIYGNSASIVWNNHLTDADSNYAPTFTDIAVTSAEQTSVNIQYKPQGDTNTYNISNVPAGYADNGTSIIGTAETITDGQDIVHVMLVTKANSYGSDNGTITLTVANDVANDIPGTSIATSSTPFTKAVTMDGQNDSYRMYSSSNGRNVMNRATTSMSSTVTPGRTAAIGAPWMASIWFRKTDAATNLEECIFGYGIGTSASHNKMDMSMLNGNLIWKVGTQYNQLKWVSDLTINQNEWYGLLVTYDGGTTGSASGSINDYYGRYKIYRVSASGVVTELTGTWSHLNFGFNSTISSGRTYVGTRYYNSSSAQIDVAMYSQRTLNLDAPLPDTAEMSMFCNDIKGYQTTYMDGNILRQASNYSNNGSHTYQQNATGSNQNNQYVLQSFWFGDGQQGNEPYNLVRNQAYWYSSVYNNVLYAYNMTSSDMINATPS